MKLTCALLFASVAFAQTSVSAQTTAPAKPATHPAAPTHCSKLPEISAKVPTVPAGLPCAKPLYTLTPTPPAKLSDALPLAAADIRATIGLETPAFSLSYIDTKVGSGPMATPKKWYTVQYTGYLIDGTVFDSSAEHPDHTPMILQQGHHQVILGWDTGFYGMHVGGKRRLFIPAQLGYGNRPSGKIPPNSWLIFDLELVSQSDKDPSPAPKAPEPPAAHTSVPTPVPAPATPATPVAPSAAPAPAPVPTPAAPKP